MSESPDILAARLASRDLDRAAPKRAEVTKDRLIVDLTDGRTMSVPLKWYPRLAAATPEEQRNLEISRCGVHWPDLDEDVSVRGLLLGRRSGESRTWVKWWLRQRDKGRNATFMDYVSEKRKKGRATRSGRRD